MGEPIKPMKLGIKRPVTRPLLPDPEPRKVEYTLISVDDHLMEPPHTFEGRMPREYEDRAPRVVETEEGHQVWSIDGTPYFQVGFMCVAGRPKEDHRVEPARFHVEKALGGNNSGNKGVDYARVLASSQHAPLVKALYKKAGLDLRADLRDLTTHADITADPAAVAAGRRTSSAGQGLAVPLLDIHTTADDLVPVEQESRLAARVRASGDAAHHRQAYVERQGHCAFTTAETVAALHALESRLDTGRWGASATPAALQSAATALGLDGAAYIPYRPAELTIGPRP